MENAMKKGKHDNIQEYKIDRVHHTSIILSISFPIKKIPLIRHNFITQKKRICQSPTCKVQFLTYHKVDNSLPATLQELV